MVQIESAPDRDTLARAVIGSVRELVPESQAALLLVVRGQAAVSDNGFCRDGLELPALAVPLTDHPTLVAAVRRRRVTSRGSSGDLGAIDFLLLASLGVKYGDLVVAPVPIAGHVMAMLVVAADRGAATTNLDAIAAAAGKAFTRLLRNVSA
jgi:hypothetical protein